MEKLIRHAILHHVFDNDFISDYQHGFLPLEVLDKLTEILDNGSDVNVIYLDLAKAFDSLPSEHLLAKLQSFLWHQRRFIAVDRERLAVFKAIHHCKQI